MALVVPMRKSFAPGLNMVADAFLIVLPDKKANLATTVANSWKAAASNLLLLESRYCRATGQQRGRERRGEM